jgi:hypothetical protein
MLIDRYALPLSTSSGVARDAYVTGCDCILSAVAGVEANLARALEADAQFALAHVAVARGHFVKAEVPQARAAAAKARSLMPSATPREQSHVNAIALAIEGNATGSLEASKAHLAQWPRDAMVLAPATGVFGLVGFSGTSPSSTSCSPTWRPTMAAIGGSSACWRSPPASAASSTRP